MVDRERYALYREESKLLAAIGAHVDAQVGSVTVRLPRAVAEAVVAAWERDDPDGDFDEETHEQYALRTQAGDLALIGLAISDDGRWEGEEVVVDLHVHSAGAAWLQAAELGLTGRS